MRTQYYTATSLDGFIDTLDDSLESSIAGPSIGRASSGRCARRLTAKPGQDGPR